MTSHSEIDLAAGPAEDELKVPDEMWERVFRGVAWLDLNHPGWEQKISLGQLHMERSDSCICGQVLGHYYKFEHQYGQEAAKDCGFFATSSIGVGEGTTGSEYPLLDLAWTQVVQERVGQ
jgi:hypothetical protein